MSNINIVETTILNLDQNEFINIDNDYENDFKLQKSPIRFKTGVEKKMKNLKAFFTV